VLIRLYLKGCRKLPRDAYFHLGFRINNGTIKHLVATPRGKEAIHAKCQECVFYKLLERTYVYGAPTVEDGVIKLVVSDNRAVRRILAEHYSQVIKIEPLKHAQITLTKKQRAILSALARGHNVSTLARERGVSKVAVYKLFKNALRKLAVLMS